MRTTVLVAGILIGLSVPAAAQYGQRSSGGLYGTGTGSNPSGTYHQGYVTPRGTYVQPHFQSTPNTTQMDNWGSRGNQNPYTGQYGTHRPKY